MKDLFDIQMRPATHKATLTEIIIVSTEWYKGEINYNCIIPEQDEKGKWQMCNATYNENEVLIQK
jgi:hypothetical protein